MVLVDAYTPDLEEKWLAVLPKDIPDEQADLKKFRNFVAVWQTNKVGNPEKMDVATCREQVREANGLGEKPLPVVTHSPDWKVDPKLPNDISEKLEVVAQAVTF